MSMPSLRAIRRAMPGARISHLVKPWVAPLFEKSPDIDDIISYDDRYKGILGKFALSKALKQENYDMAILLQNAFDAAMVAYLAGIPERIGYGRDFRSLMLTKSILFSGEDRRMHHIDYYLELLRRAGFEAPYSIPWLELSLEERLWAREELKPLRRPVIGINPGAQFGPAKQWMPERFAEIIRRISEELDGSTVLFGGPSEVKLAEEIINMASVEPARAFMAAGKTTLRELSALISECDALVSTDSGPMHIGYATRTPLVAIFGSTSPTLTGPVGYGFKVVSSSVECSPCFERRCNKKEVMRCMEAITAEDVMDALKDILPINKAVFFDRDGTLCEYTEYLSDWHYFKVMDDITSLTNLINMDYLLIGVTNQSGIARGLVRENFVKEVNAAYTGKYRFRDFYYCPHHPDEHCSCRKPEPEMLLRARAEHRVDLKRSFVVGDRESDILLAKAVGAKSVLIDSDRAGNARQSADFIAKGLTEAVELIISN